MKLLSFLLFLLNIPTFAETIVGKAYIENQLVYVEKHYPQYGGNGLYEKLKTEYFDAGNNKFAQIVSDFKNDKFIPNSLLEDFRHNTKEEIIFDPKNVVVNYKKELKQKQEKSQSFKVVSNSIADQGFHNYIVANFDELLKTQKKISIIVASQKDYFYFLIDKKKISNDKVHFVITPNNFFLKQLVTPIELEYSISNKRLLRFYGLSNLNDEKGKSQVVNIVYEYNS